MRTPPRALAALRRRPLVRAVLATALETGDVPGLVGGAVRDAFLGGTGGDLDIVLSPGRALPFAEALARRFGTRVVPIGSSPKRVLRVPAPGGEVDVWPLEGSLEEDLLRRDFTVNALRVDLPSLALSSPEGALEDLRRRLLRPPRPGVLLEDPLRILRACRLGVQLGFTVDPAVLPELRRAARRLPRVAPERRLAELRVLLEAGGRGAVRAFSRLESWGALAPLLPGSTEAGRRRGIRRLGRLRSGEGNLALVVLLSGLPPAVAEAALSEWKVSRSTHRLAATLHSLPRPPAGRPTLHDAVRFIRRTAPFSGEAVAFASILGGVRRRALAAACQPLLAPARLARVLAPKRPAPVEEIASWAGGVQGPELGALLEIIDEALASGEARGRRRVRALCEEASRP